jgi:CRP-like cAMP-binding protein
VNDVLRNHIKKFINIDDVTLQQALRPFVTINLNKRQTVQEEGALCSHLYFVAEGCLRLFYYDEKGTEQTIQFALENWWMTDIDAFNNKSKSMYSIQAVEKSSLLAITKDDFDKLLLEYPELEKYFRHIYERAYSASLFRMKVFRLSKEAFYCLVLK